MLTVDGPVEMNQLLESGLSGLALPPVKTVVEKNDARIQTGNGWSGTGSTAAGLMRNIPLLATPSAGTEFWDLTTE